MPYSLYDTFNGYCLGFPVRLCFELPVINSSQFGGLRADAFQPGNGECDCTAYLEGSKFWSNFFQVFCHNLWIFNI